MKLKKVISSVIYLCVLVGIFSSCSNANKISKSSEDVNVVELNVSAAASLTDSLNEISQLYKKAAPNVKIIYNFAASGTLQTQIEEGAPVDVFISAAQKQMNTLSDKNFILDGTRKDILKNEVVLITTKAKPSEIKAFEDCATDKSSMIAIGNPESVPVGQYTKDIFTSLGLWDEISKKANFAADVKGVLSWVETGNVDCGVVYKTDAQNSDKINIVCLAPAGSHKAVIYPVGIVKTSKNPNQAKAFLEYLSTDDAMKIFEKYGFSPNK